MTLRQDMPLHLGVRPGAQIARHKRPDGRVELRAARPAGQRSAVFDILKSPSRLRLSVAEIGRIAATGRADRQ